MSRQPVLHIPSASKWDENINLKICGLNPFDIVDIVVTVKDEADVTWRSHAVFQANQSGEVNPAAAIPLKGTYQVQDQMGLFWSMQPVGSSRSFQKKSVHPSVYRIEVRQNERVILSKEIKRLLVYETIKRQEIEENGFSGVFFRPLTADRPPVIIVLGGSDGGLDETIAGMLSNYGYATFAIPYFQYKQLPKTLAEIPLEYFQKAIAWLLRQEGLDHGQIGIFGRSKGGELALLIGSHFPDIRFVISHVGGGIVFQGVGLKKLRQTSSWSLGGAPLAFAPLPLFTISQLWTFMKQKITRQPQSFLELYQKALHNIKDDHPSIIKAENIKGPVFLTSSTDDLVWPSAFMSEKVVERLKVNGFPHSVQHLCFENAGHNIRPPYFPTAARQSGTVVYGGETAADALASQTFWRELLLFLEKTALCWQNQKTPL
ncbi:acyl-CoA thioesterase/bile acid-CoA:amino acid N-acyltransferase family protein [Bacillus swezeyi]|nr:acyl-CoA thioesterase/bile acid-CoA:amino acid N-acyltransferase family protein [Bacillus swezeyi]MEC1261752.1 acyl-CoA thioesterase/bile acid-CoA:amino acid N-acyltransferase family protein [Bacillus swezeyi]MED2926385.1 acyl-CoA thioesterase/bile acid-CoA:amino acid N-acyltransferase family protein [Bacillus swezeyi]MED2943855.1 acyl-CoA thioesterase/bile acid-CoA:amino acid N-acyltransferase family protein [Bacillus swezeyi]MED2966052.1 acyl-CoA thioesterase/bile acid-CoA:amino acid N-acy